MRSLWIAVLVGLGMGCAPAAAPPSGDLASFADAVVAAEIVSTDYDATAADGPMVAVAKVMKSLKGPLGNGGTFRFEESAWVGPSFQKGEQRILYLEKVVPHGANPWRVLSRLNPRIDILVETESLPGLTRESLDAFMKSVEASTPRPRRVTFGGAPAR